MSVTQATGRRKKSNASIFLKPGKGEITINKKHFKKYFPSEIDRDYILTPLKLLEKEETYDITARVRGGGLTGQKESLQLAISKGLLKIEPASKPILKEKKLLATDSRQKEPKKPGHRKARATQQWSKR